jgi:hypothetical protein
MTLTTGNTIRLPGSLANLSDETFYFFEKLIQHHLSHAVEHPLPDAGYQASYFRIRAVFEYCLAVIFF